MDMFSAANGVNGSTAKEWVDETRSYVVSSNAITIPYKINADDVYIDGMKMAESEPSSEGEYKVDAQDGNSTITFNEGDFDDGAEVQVFFQREVENVHTMNTTTTAPSSRGEVIARWPVYAGSNDGAESAIKGYVQIMMPLARVTALPGFDTSYKTAATNAVTFSAMDAGRADELWYRIQFIPLEGAKANP